MSTFDPPSMFPQLSVRSRLRAPDKGVASRKLAEPSLPAAEPIAGRAALRWCPSGIVWQQAWFGMPSGPRCSK